MKRMKYILLIGAVAVFTNACKKVLDVEAKGSYTSGNYWRNESDAVDGISGIYTLFLKEDYIGFVEYTYDNCSDDQYHAGDHPEDDLIEKFAFDASNPSLKLPWKWKYETINRADNALIYIPKITAIDPDVKNRCLGEAYFLRAFAYWRLTLVYGEVPLVSEADVLAGNYNNPKSSVDSVRAQIESDLLKAADLLPEAYSPGRANKGSAWGMLAKLYLYEDNFDKAIEFGTKVTTNANYAMAPTYAANFIAATSNNSEMLLNVQTTDGWGYSDFTTYHGPRAWGGWNFFQPVKGLVDEFEAGDPRKDVCIMKPGDKIDIGTEIATYTADLSTTGYHYGKFTNWKSSGGLNYSLKSPLLRSADIYLVVAEAKIRKSGAGAGDAEINAVRKRASASLTPVSGAGMPALMHERRVELCGENERHQDLMRWDKDGLVNIVTMYAQPKLGSDGQAIEGGRAFTKPRNYYFPLPQSEIDRSKGILIQNPEYTK